MTRILAVLAILLSMALLAPAADASELAQHHGAGVHVGHGVGHPGFSHFGHPFGFGFRGFVPFLPPVVALPPQVVEVAVPVPVTVPIAQPIAVEVPVPVAVPAPSYAPALPVGAPPCGCPTQ